MSYKITFSKLSLESIAKIKKSSPQSFKKIVKLLDEIQEHPRTGTGDVEPMSGGASITYSRRINKKDRLVYNIYDEDESVHIVSAEGHYTDK